MERTQRDVINTAYLETVMLGEFDVAEGNKPIHNDMSVCEIPDFMYNHVIHGGKGCCFVFSSYLMKLLRDNGIDSYMITTSEGNGIRSSILYENNGTLFVANPVEDIEFFTENNMDIETRQLYYPDKDATFVSDSKEENHCEYTLKEFSERFGTVRLFPLFNGNSQTLGSAMRERVEIAVPGEFWCESLDDIKNSLTNSL